MNLRKEFSINVDLSGLDPGGLLKVASHYDGHMPEAADAVRRAAMALETLGR